ncbi:CD99 antigen [Lepus europaeus]|uniref:CD99 antigen n=1 Tax=Lepus europaeus TaxID=9983 RepID=UPI002B45A903|nr:CD99 antigen [Lepus europaeus]
MAARAALPGLLLLLLIAGLRAQDDLDLADALPDGRDTQPTATPRKPSPGDSGPPKPKPKPKPDSPGTSGGFSDADLNDVSERRPAAPGAAGGDGDGEAAAAQPPGLVPGIVSAVAVAAVGAISSFIAYQRRRLCFREGESSTA